MRLAHELGARVHARRGHLDTKVKGDPQQKGERLAPDVMKFENESKSLNYRALSLP